MMVMMGSDCVMCVGWDFGKDGMMIFQCSALGFPLEFPSPQPTALFLGTFELWSSRLDPCERHKETSE